MGLASWAKVLKYLILLFNLIFFICGISMICIGAAISIKFEITPAVLSHLPELDSGLSIRALTSAPIACVVAGVIVMLVVMFGCIGAWREGPCLLGLFSFLMIVCVIVQFTAAVGLSSWKSITNADEQTITKHFQDIIDHYDPNVDVRARAVDTVQTILKCCGSEGPEDWRNSTAMNNTANGAFHMPRSCCQTDILAETACDSDVAGSYQYHQGCITAFMDIIESNSKYLVGSVVTIALLEILGIVFSCMLLKKIRQSTGYEPQFNNY